MGFESCSNLMTKKTAAFDTPPFCFLITACAIMRREGINLGKAGYVPHMFRFVRAETAG